MSAQVSHYTFFMRDAEQLAVLAGPLLDEFVARAPHVRIWSAACSTGEEPYSIAIALLESGTIADDRLAIRATDLVPAAVAHARTGTYPLDAFRMAAPDIRERWFHARGDGFVPDERLRARISFDCVDLLDAQRVAAEGPFDAIVCRNVLEYGVTEPQRRAVIASLANALRPGGYLLVGYYETSVAGDGADRFERVVFGDAAVYRRKPEAAQ